jgi:hypothetical protein
LAGNDDAGYFADYAVPTNAPALSTFHRQVIDLWRRALRRRSQADRTSWTDMDRLANRWLPEPRISHPWARSTLPRQTPDVGPVCGNAARTILCGWAHNNLRPYRE